jgi:cytochrome c
MDTLEVNKFVGAILVGGLVAMVTGAVAHLLVAPKHHEGGEMAAISSGAAPEPSAAPAPATVEPVSPLLAKADPHKGQQIAMKCQACHDFTKGGPNKIGPNLWGIVGSKPAEVPGYSFSDAMKAREDKPWTYEALNDFLAAPRSFVPGTKMTFAGLPKVEDRADVIAYLRTLADSPLPLPSAADIAAAQSAAAAPAAAATTAPAATTTAPAATTTAPAATTTAAAQPSTAAAPAAGTASAAQPAASAAGTTATAAPAAPAAAPAGVAPIAERLKAADLSKGEAISKKCIVCHSFAKGAPNKVGPNLWGIVGSKPAEVPGYTFSDAMKAREDKPWTYEALDSFLTSPRTFVPGTKMTFPGLAKPQDRADIIAWLRQQADAPVPLP